jgi:uncharacterized membrane protein
VKELAVKPSRWTIQLTTRQTAGLLLIAFVAIWLADYLAYPKTTHLRITLSALLMVLFFLLLLSREFLARKFEKFKKRGLS